MNLQIAIIISVFGLCVTMPIFARYFAYANLSLFAKMLGFILCLIVAILPMFASRNWAPIYGKHFAAMEYVLYFIYIFAIILFALTFIRDIMWILLSFIKGMPSPFNVSIFNKVNLTTVILAFLCTGWSLYEGTKTPDIKHFTITDPKITQERTIVVLSDLHISRTVSPTKIKAIVDKANTQQPDIILLAGDIVDDDVNIIQNTTHLLSNLEAKEGVYFVSGNHEFYIGYQNAMRTLAGIGLTSIENRKLALKPNFYLAGVSDIPTTKRFGRTDKVNEVLSGIPDSAYTLLVSHSPTPMDLPYDLQVSGHTHGGQIFPFHIFSWFGNHRLLAGFYPKERIYISRGAGQWGPQMRFLAPSEITVLHLKK
ncbi:MAG: metallophosphoesterase [Alphaproteobacteria bacterium]|nr:metallophosphoesterase [Alphaproteobacteria bacterium]